VRIIADIMSAELAEISDVHPQRDDWPRFYWDQDGLAEELATVRHRQGRLIGRMEGLGFRLREEAVLSTLTQGVLKSSEIEGEILDIDQVRSSLARRLRLVER
jgi:Fic family protein